MSHFFVDSSALIKRYTPEIGSAWVRSWILPKARHTIMISRLTTVEIVSAIMRRQREASISLLDAQRFRNYFLAHLRQQYMVVELDTDVLVRARRLLVKHPLRTLDAIQLACALEGAKSLGVPLTFVSADARLLAAASGEGLPADDPNAHP